MHINEIAETCFTFICPILPILLVVFLMSGIFFFERRRIYYYKSNEWLDIKNNPIPDDIRGYLATDGKDVSYQYSLKWGPYGKVFFSEYDKTFITHWMPLPQPPKRK